jgi:putative ABC transport system substrate-binding protein
MRPTGFAVVLAVSLFAASLAAHAQQAGKVHRIGYLGLAAPTGQYPRLELLRRGLAELGYVEGRNVVLEVRLAGGAEQFPKLAAELVRLKVDVIVTTTGTLTSAAKNATRTIPIVMMASGDAVGQGLVASLARPGGNVTGLTMISHEVSGKRLEALREMLPKLSRVGVLWCGDSNPVTQQQWTETKAAADVLGLQLSSLEAPRAEKLESALARAGDLGVQAIVVFDCSTLHPNSDRIVALAAKRRLPGMYPFPRYVDGGGLMSYGAADPDAPRRVAIYVDKILKGARPADLPVEQPTTFELVINLKTAKALGLTVPQSLLVRADRVIQ